LFVAPFSAGIQAIPDLAKVLLGFFIFCLVSSMGYIFNDMMDVEIDKTHPMKKSRPFASGALSENNGYSLVLLLGIVATLGLILLPKLFGLVVLVYLLNTILYTKFFKYMPVVEMFIIAIGFVLRLVSGALILDLYISEWFLIVGGFGALFIVSTKRLAELRKGKSQIVRSVINEYSPEFLISVVNVSIAVCVTSYCYWAFSQPIAGLWYQMSVIPFVMGVFRYLWISERQMIEAPEDAFTRDKNLILMSFVHVLILFAVIYQ